MKINYGAGSSQLEGYINIDIEPSIGNFYSDLRKVNFPYENNSVEEIACTHCIEHIEYKFHHRVLSEFHRVLIPAGRLILSYPEFHKVASNFIRNYKGLKDFWRMTLYGRQLYAGDYHVTPMDTLDLIEILKEVGFKEIEHGPEPDESYNTFLVCRKGIRMKTHEDVIREEVFGSDF